MFGVSLPYCPPSCLRQSLDLATPPVICQAPRFNWLTDAFGTWFVGSPFCFGESSPVGTLVAENECVGRPGVRSAHVERIGRFGAELPGGVEVVQFVVFAVAFADYACGSGVVVGEAFVDDAVENN